jgi:maleate isomerase
MVRRAPFEAVGAWLQAVCSRDVQLCYADGVMKPTLPRRRIGMLTPSSNTVLEPVTQAMLAGTPSITAHFSRFKVTEIALDESALAQFDDAPILRAAELLAHAKVDVISWNGTSASWLGFERDERLKERIAAATGITTTTCILSLLDILRRTGIRTQALVTPYTSDVQERIISTYAAKGITCPVERHLGIRDNFTFGTVPEADIAEMIRACMSATPDAITILCTNMDGARTAAALETPDGPLVLDSVAVTLWGCLTAIGVRPDAIQGFGRVFRDPRLNP